MNEPKLLDPRLILLNSVNEIDETLTLRLALDRFDIKNNSKIFWYLWSFPGIYTDHHLLQLIQYLGFLGQDEVLNRETPKGSTRKEMLSTVRKN
jgi:hypothetical protein